MDLLKGSIANISMTNEAAIRIGRWLNMVDCKAEDPTREEKTRIMEKFKELLTRLGYPEEEFYMIFVDQETKQISIFNPTNGACVADIDFYPQINEFRIENAIGDIYHYKAYFDKGLQDGIYLKRKIAKRNIGHQFLDIEIGENKESYNATIQNIQDKLQISITRSTTEKESIQNEKWINIPALESVLQSVTFPIVLEPLSRQIYDTLDEKVKETYNLKIVNYCRNELINQLKVEKGELTTFIELEANKTPNLGSGKGEPRTRTNGN